MKETNHYYAWIQNDQGATQDGIGHSSSINETARLVRQSWGSGWNVHIVRVEIDGSNTEVKSFRIR